MPELWGVSIIMINFILDCLFIFAVGYGGLMLLIGLFSVSGFIFVPLQAIANWVKTRSLVGKIVLVFFLTIFLANLI